MIGRVYALWDVYIEGGNSCVRHWNGAQSTKHRAQSGGAACGGIYMPLRGTAAPQYKKIAAFIILERLSIPLRFALCTLRLIRASSSVIPTGGKRMVW